jgi:short-subunit dehydrogenase
MALPAYHPFAADSFKRYILITGASMGIGEAFAREFAKRGRNLVLVARSTAKMELLAEEFQREYAIKVAVCAADLGERDSPHHIFEFCRCRSLDVDLLVNCAGVSRAGDFEHISVDKLEEIVMVNVMSLTKLTRLFLPGMTAMKNGGIINVSSLAGFQGVPGLGLYSATKSFIIKFTESLHAELKESGISVIVVCPGFTDTAIYEHSGHNTSNIRLPISGTKAVVDEAIKGLIKNKIQVAPTMLDRILVFSQRMVSREISTNLAGYFAGARGD